MTRPALPYQAPLPARPQDPAYLPPPAYDRPPAGQAPREALGFESFQPYPPQGPGGGQPPLGPPSRPFQGPPRQPPRRHDRDRSGTPAVLWIVLLVIVLGGGAAGLLIAHPFSHPSTRQSASSSAKATASAGAGSALASPAASAAASPAGSSGSSGASTSASAVAEQQAAANVAAMLQRSVSDRAAIKTAYNEVLACDPKMTSASQVFTSAATSRQQLLTSLGTMSGRAALPPALLSDLTQAWQASIAADQAFAQWANDELANCTPNDTGSAAYQATVTPDNNATKYKTLFVAQWNPIAAKYGLTRYQQGQL